MFVLSFRDMALASMGAVTSAAVYDIDPLDSGYIWSPARPQTLKLASWDAVGTAFRRKHVLFLVHGFNVNRDRGYTGLGSFAQELMGSGPLANLPSPETLKLLVPGVDLVVPVLWPGDWYLPINYPAVLPDARTTGRNFADFVLSSATRMSKVSFFSHSFGVRVVLEAVQAVAVAKAGYAAPVFDTAILTAAAASDTVLDNRCYEEAVACMRRIVVVSATTDAVLADVFPLGNIVEQALWANDPGPDVALGHSGPRLQTGSTARSKTTWYDVDALNPPVHQQHGDYLPAPYEAGGSLPNGWSDKRERIASLTQAVFANRAAKDWAPTTIPGG